MENYSLSITIGEGNIGHNSNPARRKKLENVDPDRVKNNVNIVHTDIKEAYHLLFDEAVNEYNLTQKRSDRRIQDYYKKIAKSKKEKPFYEFVIQIGNMDLHPDSEVSNQIFTELVNRIQTKYPQIHIFGAYVHNDEATPHMHLDYIPFAYYEKGQRKRVSLSKAMTQMGYSFSGTDERDKGLYKAWRNDLMNDFESICIEHGIVRVDMHNTEKHDKNVQHYKEGQKLKKQNQELSLQNADLESSIIQSTNELNSIQTTIDEKEIELSELENKLLDNPTKLFTDDQEITSTIRGIKSEMRDSSSLIINNSTDIEAIPDFNENWLDRNVEYIQPKKDFLGKIKEPAHVKISMEEWENKQKDFYQNRTAFNGLSSAYRTLATKYEYITNRFKELYNQTVRKVNAIENGIKAITSLPSFMKWKDIQSKSDELNEIKQSQEDKDAVINKLRLSMSIMKNQVEKSRLYQNFYQRVLPILYKSKTIHGYSSFEEAIFPYDDETKATIINDLKNYSYPEYKKLVI